MEQCLSTLLAQAVVVSSMYSEATQTIQSRPQGDELECTQLGDNGTSRGNTAYNVITSDIFYSIRR